MALGADQEEPGAGGHPPQQAIGGRQVHHGTLGDDDEALRRHLGKRRAPAAEAHHLFRLDALQEAPVDLGALVELAD